MALNPTLRIIRISDGSLLDDKSMSIIREMAKAKDYQIWIEVVGDRVGIQIEDGVVKGAPIPHPIARRSPGRKEGGDQEPGETTVAGTARPAALPGTRGRPRARLDGACRRPPPRAAVSMRWRHPSLGSRRRPPRPRPLARPSRSGPRSTPDGPAPSRSSPRPLPVACSCPGRSAFSVGQSTGGHSCYGVA
jgi:hypothetical protein